MMVTKKKMSRSNPMLIDLRNLVEVESDPHVGHKYFIILNLKRFQRRKYYTFERRMKKVIPFLEKRYNMVATTIETGWVNDDFVKNQFKLRIFFQS